MNAYLFSAGSTVTAVTSTLLHGGETGRTVQTWDGCASAIVYGGEVESARQLFETWLCSPPDAEHPPETIIKKLVAAPFAADLITESGNKPPDWAGLDQQLREATQNNALDEFEQGYWVDINQTLPPGKIIRDIESLKRDLPEDVCSGLNWSADKQFFFLINVLSKPLPPPGYFYETESAENDPEPASDDEPSAKKRAPLDGSVLSLPELMEKDAAALVRARNSVVAAWLWRKYAANTRLVENDIYISPCCTMIPFD